MREHTPPESVHALNLAGLRCPAITFWTAREGEGLLGCGALKELDPGHGEIKSMRTAAAHLRVSVASTILRHIIEAARGRGDRKLSLETGSIDAFASARALSAGFGFDFCGPFADYREHANGVFLSGGI